MGLWKVLIVDDSRAVIDSLRETLDRLGVDSDDIFQATNASDALRSFREQKPPVVFLDIDLGSEKGEAVAKEMLESVSTTKVILMTGLNLNHPRVRGAVSAGAYEVLQKPLRLARIKELLQLIDSEEKGLRRI